MKRKALYLSVLVCFFVGMITVSQNIYSDQQKSFFSKLFSKAGAEKSEFHIDGVTKTTPEMLKQRKMSPLRIVISESSSNKKEITNWLDKNITDKREVITFEGMAGFRNTLNELKPEDKTIFLGEFELNGIQFANGRFSGLPKEIAEKNGIKTVFTANNLSLKNDATLENMTIIAKGNITLYDNSGILNSRIHVEKGAQIIASGSPHSITISGNEISCGDSRPDFDTDSATAAISVIGSGMEYLSNEFYNCYAGIWVAPGSNLEAIGNNIHDNTFGIIFDRGRDEAGLDDPPTGYASANVFNNNYIDVYLDVGVPNLSNGNSFSGSIGILNASPHAMGDPLTHSVLATSNRWSLPNTAANKLSVDYDYFSNLDFGTIVGESGRKNVVNIGPRRSVPNTITGACSLIVPVEAK